MLHNLPTKKFQNTFEKGGEGGKKKKQPQQEQQEGCPLHK